MSLRGARGPSTGSGTEPVAEPVEAFPPTLREVMVRPRWIGMLVLSLVIAGVFAWLGQWQLARAIDMSPPVAGATEEIRPIADVTSPGAYLPDPLVGQRVAATGRWVPGDFLIVSSRFNDDVEGYWVTGQLRLDPSASGVATPTSLAVAVGWTADRQVADAAVATLAADAIGGAPVAVTGRIISDEGPAVPPASASPMELTKMSPAMLLGRWHDVEELGVYRGYVTSTAPFAGLEAISSPAPAERGRVNWLNIFYAAEWAVFAGFAFYLWYRLAKDAWEKELEDLEESRTPGR